MRKFSQEDLVINLYAQVRASRDPHDMALGFARVGGKDEDVLEIIWYDGYADPLHPIRRPGIDRSRAGSLLTKIIRKAQKDMEVANHILFCSPSAIKPKA